MYEQNENDASYECIQYMQGDSNIMEQALRGGTVD